jgi:hypothetical protein
MSIFSLGRRKEISNRQTNDENDYFSNHEVK